MTVNIYQCPECHGIFSEKEIFDFEGECPECEHVFMGRNTLNRRTKTNNAQVADLAV